MAALPRNEKRRLTKEFADLTQEALEALSPEFLTRYAPPLEVVCFTKRDLKSLNIDNLGDAIAMYSNNKAYFNLEHCCRTRTYDACHTVGEEAAHHLHHHGNLGMMPLSGESMKHVDPAKWLEARNIEELVGFWGGCIFAAHKGYNPRHLMPTDFSELDDEHRIGYDVAARLIRAITPLRLQDFVDIQSWQEVRRRCRGYIQMPPDDFERIARARQHG